MESQTQKSRFEIRAVRVGRKVEKNSLGWRREIRDDHDSSGPFCDEQQVGRAGRRLEADRVVEPQIRKKVRYPEADHGRFRRQAQRGIGNAPFAALRPSLW